MGRFKLLADLPQEGPLWEHVVKELKKKALLKNNLYFRTISYYRLKETLQNGTDRDNNSNLEYNDNEKELMTREGLSPFIQKDRVTWITKIEYLKRDFGKQKPYAIVIYDGDCLKILNTANGFAMFIAPFIQQRALLAVFKRD
ncbi:MAG: hypothetical protein Q8R18_06540 [bacterium]|nr:hypothetical protein [bacterium]